MKVLPRGPDRGAFLIQDALTGTATITDADTIVIGAETIRLQGVDAPETDQICLGSRGGLWNCGIVARNRLIQYIGSRETSCATNGKDAFGRWLATCSTNEGDLSAWLVARASAWLSSVRDTLIGPLFSRSIRVPWGARLPWSLSSFESPYSAPLRMRGFSHCLLSPAQVGLGGVLMPIRPGKRRSFWGPLPH
jgi:hypothetical protein